MAYLKEASTFHLRFAMILFYFAPFRDGMTRILFSQVSRISQIRLIELPKSHPASSVKKVRCVPFLAMLLATLGSPPMSSVEKSM